MSIGWLDSLAEAETYFSTERLETVHWDALAGAQKTGQGDQTGTGGIE